MDDQPPETSQQGRRDAVVISSDWEQATHRQSKRLLIGEVHERLHLSYCSA